MTAKADIKRFWLLAHAWQSLRLARDAHGIILGSPKYPNPDDPILKSAVTTMYVAYSRPFRENRGLPRLEESSIPTRYSDLHQRILDYRDKTIAHKDKTAHAIAALVNHVAIVVSNGRCGVCPVIHFPSADELQRFPGLVTVVLEWVESEMNKSYHSHIEPLGLRDGRYIVDPTKFPKEWIRPDK